LAATAGLLFGLCIGILGINFGGSLRDADSAALSDISRGTVVSKRGCFAMIENSAKKNFC
jgi:hypothetical protein